MQEKSDLDNQPQKTMRGIVRLSDKRGFEIFNKSMTVHTGEPIGDWVEFLGVRIALRRVRSDVFDGIVPNFRDVIGPLVTSDQKGTNDAEAIDNT